MGTAGLEEVAAQRIKSPPAGRRVEEIMVPMAGRSGARLAPVEDPQWRDFCALQDLFNGAEDPHWEEDRDRIDPGIRDLWGSE